MSDEVKFTLFNKVLYYDVLSSFCISGSRQKKELLERYFAVRNICVELNVVDSMYDYLYKLSNRKKMRMIIECYESKFLDGFGLDIQDMEVK